MISRSDLINHYLSPLALDSENSTFWIAEKIAMSPNNPKFKAEWFVLTPFPESVTEMHDWLSENIKGVMRCFSPELFVPGRNPIIPSKNYWWGFETQADAMVWELRWA